jgi:hypothetical protein
MSKFFSDIVPSRRLNDAKGFLDSIEKTTAHPERIEVLFKFDSDQMGVREFIEAEIKKRPFDIKYIVTPRLEGNYSLWLACNKLFFMSSQESYFVQALSDEVRIKTMGWDDILLKYMGFFPDHIFRLRTSTQKLCNYYTQFECNYVPDSFPIYTRQWLNLTDGFGDCWGSDAYQQAVAFHMGLGVDGYKSTNRSGALYRDISIHNEIKYQGIAEYGVDISAEQLKLRTEWIYYEWNRLVSHCKQEEFSYYARRIYLYVFANKNNIKHFRLMKDEKRKKVSLIDLDSQKVVSEVSYAVSFFYVFFSNLRRKLLKSTGYVQRISYEIWLKIFCVIEFFFYIPKVLFSLLLYIVAQSFLLLNCMVKIFQFFLAGLRMIFKLLENILLGIPKVIVRGLGFFVQRVRDIGKKFKADKVVVLKNISRKLYRIEKSIYAKKASNTLKPMKGFLHKNLVEKSIALNNSIHQGRRKVLNKSRNMLNINLEYEAQKSKQKMLNRISYVRQWIQNAIIDKMSAKLYQLPPSAVRLLSAKKPQLGLRQSFGLSRAMRLGDICAVPYDDIQWAVGEIKEEYAMKEGRQYKTFYLHDQSKYDKEKYPDLGYW